MPNPKSSDKYTFFLLTKSLGFNGYLVDESSFVTDGKVLVIDSNAYNCSYVQEK